MFSTYLIRNRKGVCGRPGRSTRAGFTLIELLVVMGILSILVLIALPRFYGARAKAYRSEMQSDLRNLASAQESYFDEWYVYANDPALLDFNQSQGVTVQMVESAGNGWSAKATHTSTASQCGLYYGQVSAVSGVPDEGEGVITCTEAN